MNTFQVVPAPQNNLIDRQMETPPNYSIPHYGGPSPPLPQTQPPAESMVVHGSTPLSQIGANICSVPPSDSSGPLSPAPTTPGGSADDCDSDFTSRGGRKQKRGVLPKHATSVMRSWLFQHLVVVSGYFLPDFCLCFPVFAASLSYGRRKASHSRADQPDLAPGE